MRLHNRLFILTILPFLFFSAMNVFAEGLNAASSQFEQIDREERCLLDLVLEESNRMQKVEAEKKRRLEAIAKEKRQAEEVQRLRDEKIAIQILKAERQSLEALRQEKIKLRIAEAQRAKERRITAHIDLSQQRMKVFKGDDLIHTWRVSTARKGYVTPVGKYQPQFIERMHYSRLYHNSPMPYSIFFKGNFAIHGTNSIRRLGRRASHGCVRLHPKNAKKLYALVRKYGKVNTFINITY